jgi:amino acid transporter
MFRVIVISTIQSYLTLIKATPAIIAIILLPFFVKTDFSIPMSDVFQLPLALTFSLFGYMGFEFCCNLSHLVEGGAQAAKRAVLGGFFAVVLLYTIFHFSLLQIMGAENLATYLAGGYPQFVMHKFMLLGKALVFVVSATTVLTYFNSTNGLVFLCVTLVHALSSDKKLRFFNFWNKLSCNARPLNILAVVCLLVIGIGSLVTNTKFLMSSCLFGLSSLMIVVMLSLLKVDKKPTLFSRFVAVGGIVMSAVLLGYHWLQAGDTQIDRLIALSPLAIGLIVGALLRLNSNDDDTSVHREAVSLERQVIVKEAEMSEFAKKPKGTDTDNG